MIYIIIALNPTVDFVIRLSSKKLSEVSYYKVWHFVSYDPDSNDANVSNLVIWHIR
jgi:hypothetical protein